MYLGSSPKRSRFWCALPEGTQISRRPLEGTQMPPPGAGWDADVWMAPRNQEDHPLSGVPPKARGGILASRLSSHSLETTQTSFGGSEGRQWGCSGEAVGGGFPITSCTV